MLVPVVPSVHKILIAFNLPIATLLLTILMGHALPLLLVVLLAMAIIADWRTSVPQRQPVVLIILASKPLLKLLDPLALQEPIVFQEFATSKLPTRVFLVIPRAHLLHAPTTSLPLAAMTKRLAVATPPQGTTSANSTNLPYLLQSRAIMRAAPAVRASACARTTLVFLPSATSNNALTSKIPQ